MKKYITKQSSIKGAGKGLFTKDFFKKDEVIGLAHVNDQPASEIGRNHNHNEKNPTAYSKKINNKRFIYASRNLKPGEEITTNYRMQPELEQPEDFMRKGGALLTKKVTCKKCGWKWDAEDSGKDITTCHKCGGQGLVHAQDGGNTDAMNGMMKARLAYANEFGNPAAERMINLPDNPYQFDNGDTGSHYMASMDNYAVPQIQDENGVLQLGDYGPESNEAIRFDSDEDANYFAENYKDVSPGFIEADLDEDEIEEYRRGGYIVEEIDSYQKGGSTKLKYKKPQGASVQPPIQKILKNPSAALKWSKEQDAKDLIKKEKIEEQKALEKAKNALIYNEIKKLEDFETLEANELKKPEHLQFTPDKYVIPGSFSNSYNPNNNIPISDNTNIYRQPITTDWRLNPKYQDNLGLFIAKQRVENAKAKIRKENDSYLKEGPVNHDGTVETVGQFNKRQSDWEHSSYLNKLFTEEPENNYWFKPSSNNGPGEFITGIGGQGIQAIKWLKPLWNTTKTAWKTPIPLGRTITNTTAGTLTPKNLLFSYWAGESAYDQLDSKSDVRKSQSNFINNPSWNTLGDAAFETGVNSLGFSGIGLGKGVFKPTYNILKNYKYIGKGTKINPWEKQYGYRMIGSKIGFDDAVGSGVLRPRQTKAINTGGIDLGGNSTGIQPYTLFGKEKPLINYAGWGHTGTSKNPFMARVPQNNLNFKPKNNPVDWDVIRAKSIPITDPGVQMFQKKWWGWQPVYTSPNKNFQKGGTTNNYIELDLTPEEIQKYKDGGYVVEELPEMQSGGSPSQVWYQYTGTPWSEARKKGLTDGSKKQNTELRKRILAGEFGEPKFSNEKYQNIKSNYDRNIEKMVAQGKTLDQLVKQKVGTRAGLKSRFPELFKTKSKLDDFFPKKINSSNSLSSKNKNTKSRWGNVTVESNDGKPIYRKDDYIDMVHSKDPKTKAEGLKMQAEHKKQLQAEKIKKQKKDLLDVEALLANAANTHKAQVKAIEAARVAKLSEEEKLYEYFLGKPAPAKVEPIKVEPIPGSMQIKGDHNKKYYDDNGIEIKPILWDPDTSLWDMNKGLLEQKWFPFSEQISKYIKQQDAEYYKNIRLAEKEKEEEAFQYREAMIKENPETSIEEIDQFIQDQESIAYENSIAGPHNNYNDGPVQMVYPERAFAYGPSGGILGGLLRNPYVMGAGNLYFGAQGISEWADSDSDLRKSISKAWDDPTWSNIGDFGYELGANALNYIGLPFSKYYKNSRNVTKIPIRKYGPLKPRKPKTINLNQNPGWLQLPKYNSKGYLEYKKYQNGGNVSKLEKQKIDNYKLDKEIVSDLSKEEINKLVSQGYIVEQIN